jgi:hypothetical protein
MTYELFSMHGKADEIIGIDTGLTRMERTLPNRSMKSSNLKRSRLPPGYRREQLSPLSKVKFRKTPSLNKGRGRI